MFVYSSKLVNFISKNLAKRLMTLFFSFEMKFRLMPVCCEYFLMEIPFTHTDMTSSF